MARAKWKSDDPRRAALAERNRNRLWTPEMRTKISCSSRGRAGNRLGILHSEEAKQKMSRGQIKAWRSSERRIALSKRLLGNTHTLGFRHSEETKKRMGDAHRGMKYRPWSQEACERQRQRFLGKKHSEESKAKMSKTRKGKPLSEKNKRGISEGRKRHLRLPLYGICKCGAHSPPTSPTSLELLLRKLLSEFPEVQEQKWFGKYRVDAFIPKPYNLVFEADGSYWHQDCDHTERDDFILSQGVKAVIRLSEEVLCGPREYID